MASNAVEQRLKAAQGKVLGGVALGIVGFGLWLMVGFQILFSFIDSVEWLPVAVSVIVDVLAVVVTVVAIVVLRRGGRELIDVQDSIEIEGLKSVVGDLIDSPEPMDMSQVTDALFGLNELDLPYSVGVEPDGDDAKVTVQWRTEELKWRTLLTRGSQVMRWRMELKLNGKKGQYRFTEVSSWAKIVGSGASASLTGSAGGSRSKSLGAGSVTKVWAVGDVASPEGTGSSGRIGVRPSDAKVPVFRILRAHGWRPPRDNVWHRLWEY